MGGLERLPGEDVMDYLDRYMEMDRRESKKSRAEFRAVAQATKEKFDEVVFYCNLASKPWDETAACIEAIRAQDTRNQPST